MAFIDLFTVVIVYVILFCLILQISMVGGKIASVNFELNASSADRVQLDGDAHIVSGDIVELTDSKEGLFRDGSVGRAVYKGTIPLWNASTKEVANFTTHFQFQMEWNPGKNDSHDHGGDGLAFLMASADSGYHVAFRGLGRWLALFNPRRNGDKSNHVVAVEFDTNKSIWDVNDNHVGIDVNNITSAATLLLDEDLNDGEIWDAWVDYHGQIHVLEVSVSKGSNALIRRKLLTYEINLAEYLPENIVVGFSAAAYMSTESHRLISWSFTSVIWELPEKSKTSPASVIIIVSVCSVTFILVCLGLCFVLRRQTKREGQSSNMIQEDQQSDMDMVLDHVPRKFTYSELCAGTDNFSEKEKLGQGGSGGVYKCLLVKSDEVVAVKRISAGSKTGKREYLAEINTITRLRHRNLVQLLGWCHEQGQLLLVYEYMPNGSLDSLLFGKRRGQLDWFRRYRIASDIASALLYLHELWDECVVHRDVKSSNIMLDSEFNAKVGDFGLARLVKHDQWSQTSTIAGTLGYLAPECSISGISSAESDIFSFGAVALEIACGRRALDLSQATPKMRLVECVWELYGEGRLFDAVDRNLKGDFDRAEMETLIVVGLWCSHPDPFIRPRIRQVLQLLNFEAPIPDLPHTLPKAAYSPIHGVFFPETSNSPHTRTTSEEMALFSTPAVSSDLPTASTHSSASTNSSTIISKSSGSFKQKDPNPPSSF